MRVDLADLLKTGVSTLVFYLWSIAMMDLTFKQWRIQQKKKVYFTWTGVGIGAIIIAVLSKILTKAVGNATAAISVDDTLLTVAVILLISLTRMITVLVVAAAAVIVAVICYSNEKATKIFFAILLGLGTIIIDTYISRITEMIWTRQDEELYAMTPIGLPVYILIRIVWALIFYWLYRKFVSEYIKEVLNTPDGGMNSFVKVPVLSCITLGLMLSIMVSFDLSYDSFAILNKSYWTIAIGVLIILYIMMYVSIFKAITLSTQSMKTKAELDVASKIQASVLPRTFPAFPEREEFDIYATMEPAKEVGGDFYDFFLLDDEHLAVVIADVSGKGVPAALFMMSARTMIKNQSFAQMDPGKVLSIVNNQLAENNEEGMFVTTFFGILNLKTGEFQCSNAGHNPPYIVRADGTVEQLKVRAGFVLAGMEGIRYRNHTVQFGVKDKLLLYTDGVTEATNPKLELYGENRLEEVLQGTEKLSPKPCIEKILGSLREFADGAEQADDITMVLLEIEKLTKEVSDEGRTVS